MAPVSDHSTFDKFFRTVTPNDGTAVNPDQIVKIWPTNPSSPAPYNALLTNGETVVIALADAQRLGGF